MNLQVETSNEGEEFNFDNWLIQNNLVTLKDLFIKHDVTTLSSLSLTSPQLQSLMTDQQLLMQPQMIPKIMNAMQKLLNVATIAPTKEIIKIIISEPEQDVSNTIQSNLKALHQMEIELNKLNDEYPKSVARINSDKLKNIETAINKINEIFEDIVDAVKTKKQNILSQIEKMKSNINDNNNNNNDDEKEIDIIQQTQNKVKESRQFLQNELKIYEELTSTNNDRENRKKKVLNIGKNTNEQFNKTEKLLNDNINNINKAITTNNDTIIDIDFIVNYKNYNKMIKCVNDIGITKNKTSLKSEKIQQKEHVFIDEDEEKLKKHFETLLSFNNKSNNRWYQLDDKKQDNVACCSFITNTDISSIEFVDGEIENDVPKKLLSVSPKINNINDIDKYIKVLMRSIQIAMPGCDKTFKYKYDFDTNGILYWLGTRKYSESWTNPAENNIDIIATSSSLHPTSKPITSICGRTTVRCVTQNRNNQWIMIQFKDIYVELTKYTLRHYESNNHCALRNWRFEGSNDLKQFKTLKIHTNDKALNKKGATHTWKINSNGKRYKAFRIFQISKNCFDTDVLACSGIEFYGNVYHKSE